MLEDALLLMPLRSEVIAEIVACDLRPLSVVEEDGFHQLINCIILNYLTHLQLCKLLIVTFLLLCKPCY